MRPLRVATWNVHEGFPVEDGVSGEQAKSQIISLLSDLDIDVLGLQEVDFDADARSGILDVITANTPLIHVAHNILSESSFIPAGRAGVAVASRFPLGNLRRMEFKNPDLAVQLDGKQIRTHDKGLLSATVALPDRLLSVVSLHAFPFHIFGHHASDGIFAPIWSRLSEELGRFECQPVVIFGDFNTNKRELVLESASHALERAIKDLPTYKDQSYDDILYSPDFSARSTRTIDNFSDHRLCVTELSWTAGEEICE
jgi:endonuclease/exonuclease/phosphatase family metal-dependent hydrolase